MKALGPAGLRTRFNATQSHQASKCVGREPTFAALRPIAVEQYANLAFDMGGLQLNVGRRGRQIALVFGHFVFKDQVAAIRVPGQLGNESMILVSIIAPMGEDQVRISRPFEALELLLNPGEMSREEAVAVVSSYDPGGNRLAQKAPGTGPQLLFALAVRAEHGPSHVSRAVAVKQGQQCPAASDVHIVAMGPET